MPVWGLWLEEAFYFSTAAGSQKGRNLAANPSVAVHLESGDEVTILEGKAERAANASILGRFVDAYETKYNFRPDVSSAASPVYRVWPGVALDWEAKDFATTGAPGPFTEEDDETQR